ncbi:conserved protein [Tepidicaulis marinus]|uniref:Conserved protein n=1 Tax=Tepidicaulis marinus TaxID=1333998 RepID=A0A081BFH4_9HYPH|nr:DUF6516 family protein [Tepidicaulis marinus]GAK46792.1 conserved protein [Tepidicaulis marinus]
MIYNTRAELIICERENINDTAFVELVVWLVPVPLAGSVHNFKYRLALVIEGECVMRYDNEAGKGDHRHIDGREEAYVFKDPETPLADFYDDVERILS